MTTDYIILLPDHVHVHRPRQTGRQVSTNAQSSSQITILMLRWPGLPCYHQADTKKEKGKGQISEATRQREIFHHQKCPSGRVPTRQNGDRRTRWVGSCSLSEINGLSPACKHFRQIDATATATRYIRTPLSTQHRPHRARSSRQPPPRSPSRGRRDPRGPPRTRPPPCPHRRTSGRRRACCT